MLSAGWHVVNRNAVCYVGWRIESLVPDFPEPSVPLVVWSAVLQIVAAPQSASQCGWYWAEAPVDHDAQSQSIKMSGLFLTRVNLTYSETTSEPKEGPGLSIPLVSDLVMNMDARQPAFLWSSVFLNWLLQTKGTEFIWWLREKSPSLSPCHPYIENTDVMRGIMLKIKNSAEKQKYLGFLMSLLSNWITTPGVCSMFLTSGCEGPHFAWAILRLALCYLQFKTF